MKISSRILVQPCSRRHFFVVLAFLAMVSIVVIGEEFKKPPYPPVNRENYGDASVNVTYHYSTISPSLDSGLDTDSSESEHDTEITASHFEKPKERPVPFREELDERNDPDMRTSQNEIVYMYRGSEARTFQEENKDGDENQHYNVKGDLQDSRTADIEVYFSEPEPETTKIYAEPAPDGRSVSLNEFYPRYIGPEDHEDAPVARIYAENEQSERDFIVKDHDHVGTRRYKHKRMLRSTFSSAVNIKRSSRGVGIRDDEPKPFGKPIIHEPSQDTSGRNLQITISDLCKRRVENEGWIGDGWCDAEGAYNTAACNWDGGDCCQFTCVSLGVPGYDCSSNFDCKDPRPSKFDYSNCNVQVKAWIGDGYCDMSGGFNTAECNYDGGDCCESTCKSGSGGNCEKFECVNPNLDVASITTMSPTQTPTQLPTKAPVQAPVRNTNPNKVVNVDSPLIYDVVPEKCKQTVENWQWVGDGWCDPDGIYNSEECNYDGGDCCKQTCRPDLDYQCGTAEGVGYVCKDPYVGGSPVPAPTRANKQPTGESNVNSTPGAINNTNDPFSQSLQGDAKIWTDAHNKRRKKYQEQWGFTYVPLMWSDTMAQSAQQYANKLAQGRCEDYDHDPSNPWGENLAVIWGNHNIERVMKAWVEDEELAPDQPYSSGHGHMTQALWRASKYLGCAMGQNSECKLYVCRYIKPGNCDRKSDEWLSSAMAADTPCGPDCPPIEGCFHPLDS